MSGKEMIARIPAGRVRPGDILLTTPPARVIAVTTHPGLVVIDAVTYHGFTILFRLPPDEPIPTQAEPEPDS